MNLSKKKLLFIFFIQLCFFSLFPGSKYVIKRTDILPPVFYVGDLVELRIKVELLGQGVIKEPESLGKYFWIDFEDFKIIKFSDHTEIRIFFRSYRPGIRILPPIKMGNIVLNNIKIRTESIIGEKSVSLADPAGQVFLPGTKLFIAFVIIFVLFGPICFFLGFKWSKGKVKDFIIKYNENLPGKKIRSELNSLKKKVKTLSTKDFYTALINIFKKYLQKRLFLDFSSLTNKEILRSCRTSESLYLPVDKIESILKKGDPYKFAGVEVGAIDMLEDINHIFEIVEIIEKQFIININKKELE